MKQGRSVVFFNILEPEKPFLFGSGQSNEKSKTLPLTVAKNELAPAPVSSSSRRQPGERPGRPERPSLLHKKSVPFLCFNARARQNWIPLSQGGCHLEKNIGWVAHPLASKTPRGPRVRRGKSGKVERVKQDQGWSTAQWNRSRSA